MYCFMALRDEHDEVSKLSWSTLAYARVPSRELARRSEPNCVEPVDARVHRWLVREGRSRALIGGVVPVLEERVLSYSQSRRMNPLLCFEPYLTACLRSLRKTQ